MPQPKPPPPPAARCQPTLLVDEVLRPLLAAADLRAPQAQALAKLGKQEPSIRLGLLQALLDAQLGPSPGGGAWREPHLAVLQPLLDTRAECAVAQLARLCAALASAARGDALRGSAKLSQCVMALAAGFGAALAPAQVQELAAAVSGMQTFLTKGLLAKLRQLAPGPDGA